MLTTPQIALLIDPTTTKALATYGDAGLNCVPVSTIFIHEEEKIVLVNYFMHKTTQNIHTNTHIVLTAWKDTIGFQIKGSVDYLQQGVLYDSYLKKIKQLHPERSVQGILLIDPDEVCDISLPATA